MKKLSEMTEHELIKERARNLGISFFKAWGQVKTKKLKSRVQTWCIKLGTWMLKKKNNENLH